MRIKALRAESWRNLEPLALEPGPRVTVLHGDNGQGKTNVIEAVYYLATLRSFRSSRAMELIRHGAPQARIQGDVEVGGLERRIEVRLQEGLRTILLDGKAASAGAALFGALSAVLFVPEDLMLPRRAPSARRQFLDLAVFNVERAYYKEASAFGKVLRSRNAVLKGSGGRPDPALLDTYDEELARTGARVVVRRRAMAGALNPGAASFYATLHPELRLDLGYRSAAEVQAAEDEEAIRAALLHGLRGRRALDERRGFTTYGPHTDDLEMLLDGRPAREHASQGQLRSYVLALKLAELQHVGERRGEVPVLLLDDVPSELDAYRRRYLFETIGALPCQTLISVTDRDVVPPLPERMDVPVARGRVGI